MRRSIRLGLILLCGLIFSMALPSMGAGNFQLWSGLGANRVQAASHSATITGEPPAAEGNAAPEAAAADDNGLKPFAEVTKDFTATKGLFTVYRHPRNNKALLGLMPNQLNQNLLLITTLESGLGEAGLFRGWPVDDGLLLQFRSAPSNRLQVVVPNVFFRDGRGRPQGRATVSDSFSDSVLFALPILSIHPDSGEMLIDLTEFLLTRDPANVLAAFPWIADGYSVNPDLSYLGDTQVFPENLEMETVLGLSGSPGGLLSLFFGGLESLPDRRGFNLRVRYSLSGLPSHSAFQPRVADQRVGYFMSAYRTANRQRSPEPIVRYIHRWHLDKQDPTAALSPPQQPIVFWLENTIPPEYRAAIRDGVEWWNTAFERAGFLQAIQVEQMPDNADWDPADVRYNVIRWSDSFRSGILGIGPSRVNPLTGEILDADVILDAGSISFAGEEYQQFQPRLGDGPTATLMQYCDSPLVQRLLRRGLTSDRTAPVLPQPTETLADAADTCMGAMGLEQVNLGQWSMDLLGGPLANRVAQGAYIQDFLRVLTAHEVGHVLGLRHNFLGSTLLSPADLHNPDITRTQGMITSVMDYLPPNIAPPGQPQGDYFPHQLGAYDLWAIEYGYKPTPNPLTAQRELQAIANRATQPELAYAPDEDVWDFIDPKANRWDWSNDPLSYAADQMSTAQAILAKLDWFSLNPGESYGLLRQRVNGLFRYYRHQSLMMVNYIGGQRFSRTDPWSSRGQPAFTPIAATEQRQALDLISQKVLAADALQISPEVLRRLAPDRWWHQGQTPTVYPLDYPLYDQVLAIQALSLSELLYGDRLTRMRDADLHTPTDHLTLAELFDRLGQSVWGEILNPAAEPVSLSSLRRGLQRHHLNILTRLFLRPSGPDAEPADLLDLWAIEGTFTAPEDARLLARHQMGQLQRAIATYLNRHSRRLDTTTLAYLEDVEDRITRVLDARIQRR